MTPLAQTYARAIVGLMQAHIDGRPMRWVDLGEILPRLTVKDPAVAAAALQRAIDLGWIVRDGSKIYLTDAGHQLR